MLFQFQRSTSFHRIAWIAIWAVLLPLWVPLFHHPDVSASLTVPHCSMGMAHKAHQPTKSSSREKETCPLCQGLHMLGSGLVPPQGMASLTMFLGERDFRAVLTALFVSTRIAPAARPRAPPLFA